MVIPVAIELESCHHMKTWHRGHSEYRWYIGDVFVHYFGTDFVSLDKQQVSAGQWKEDAFHLGCLQ